MRTKERISWIDIAKGLGIILVVFGHIWRSNLAQTWLYSFHMPLFFFISGWLYQPAKTTELSYKKYVNRKLVSLIVPYVLFLTVTFLYWIVIESHFREFDQGPLWFLLVLFAVEMIAKPIAGLLKKAGRCDWIMLIIPAIAFIIVGAIGSEYAGVIGWFVKILNALLWYCLGYLVSRTIGKSYDNTEDKKKLFAIAFVFLIASIILGIKNGRVDMSINRFHNIYLYVIAAYVGIVFIFALSKLIKSNRVLEYLGRYSIIILCTHEPIKRVVIKICSILFSADVEAFRNGIWQGVIIALIVFLIEFVVIAILRALKKVMDKTKLSWLMAFIK